EMRNDLYMTLEKGEFEKGGKSVARNVEITVYVLDADGQILKTSVVYFGLLIMSMCCCLTAKDKGEKKLFGYSFVPLMQEDGRTLPDGTHELIIYKVHIINLLQDSKFQHFKPVMDTYIESHFAGALSYRDLMKVLKWYMDRIVEAEHQDHIQQVLKASEYIFKYIIQSRRLFSLATGGQNEEEFRACIHELFMSICFFLSQENKGISPVAQTQVCVSRSVFVC
ncbi:hypothetical protein XENOCAPTIV_030649, partial [Xenoophorus captivus]